MSALKHFISSFSLSIPELIILGIAALLLLIVLALRAFKKRYPRVPTIEYYAPEGMTPAEVGYVIDGFSSPEDMTSLIYYWASHGHLSIKTAEDDSFTLRRLSDLDDDHSDYEKQLFNDMWYLGGRSRRKKAYSVIDDQDNFRLGGKSRIVSSEDLSSGMKLAVRKAIRGMRGGFEKDGRRLTVKSRDLIASQLPNIAILLAIALPLTQHSKDIGLIPSITLLVLPLSVVLFACLLSADIVQPPSRILIPRLVITLYSLLVLRFFMWLITLYTGNETSWIPFFAALPFYLVTGLFEKGYLYRRVNIRKNRRFNAAGWIVGILSIAVYVLSFRNTDISPWSAAAMGMAIVICSALSPRVRALTEYGAGILARCEGFRQFLLTAEKSRLEMLLEENPNYYYDVLPYAQVLGVSSVWLQKADCIKADVPSWFSGEYGPYNRITELMMNGLDAIAGLVSRKKKRKQ